MNILEWFASLPDRVELFHKHNYEHIVGSFYLVRTQAGFKQALKCFVGEESDLAVIVNEAEGYPQSYPSVVAFHWSYRGYSYVRAECHHVKRFKQIIAEA